MVCCRVETSVDWRSVISRFDRNREKESAIVNAMGDHRWVRQHTRRNRGWKSGSIFIPIDSLFTVRSYAARPARRTAMDNRINEIRRLIRALRVSMLEAEAIMRAQINQDQECSFV